MTPGARGNRAAVLVVAYGAWIVAFEAVGRYAATLRTVDLTTPWDAAIPLIPAFVWAYELCYLLPFLPLLVLQDWRRFDVALTAMVIANLTAFAVYLLVPESFPRPALGSTLSERVLALEYAMDFSPGANNLPSMHVAASWIVVRTVHGQRGLVLDAVAVALAIAVSASSRPRPAPPTARR